MTSGDVIATWYRHHVFAGSLTLSALGWNRAASSSIWGLWVYSDTFSHGLLVLPIAGWLIWRKRDRLRSMHPEVEARGLALVALCSVLTMLGDVLHVDEITHFGLVGLLPSTVILVYGLQIAKTIRFPLLLVFLAVPFGEELIAPLMGFTADFVVQALRLLGVPVYRDGYLLQTAAGTFEIAKACSGIRYLLATVFFGVLFAYLYFRSLTKRLAFALFALGIAPVANGMRALIIVLLAHASEMRIATGVDHVIYGWLFFGVLVFAMALVAWYFADSDAG